MTTRLPTLDLPERPGAGIRASGTFDQPVIGTAGGTNPSPSERSEPPLLTIADMIRATEQRLDLPPGRRRNQASGLRLMCRFAGLPPELVPADLKVARDIFAETAPAAFGVSKSNFANIRSNVRGAFKDLRLSRQSPAGMSPAFRALFDSVPERELGYRLSRPFTFWSSEGLDPGDVGPEALARFDAHCQGLCLKSRPGKLADAAARAWDACARSVEGWPEVLLSMPKPGQGWTLPWSAFPVSFQEDAEGWLTRRGGDNLLDDESLTRTIRPTTLRRVAFTMREAASALVRAGKAVAGITSLAVLVQPDHFKRICQFLLDRHGGPTQHIHDVARELAFMARHHAKLPDAELERLRKICRRLRIKRTGPTATVRKRLAVIEEPRNLHRLVLLPTELMKLAGKIRRAPRKAARMAETAVAIELLLMTAIRRKNLAGLRLGRHVLLGNDPRQLKARIVLDEADTKNGQPLEFELPEASARLLQSYVQRHLPALAAPGQDHLFPGTKGRAKRPDNLALQISKAIREHVGCEVNVHLFRALTGRAFLRRNPGLYEVLRRVLGHQSSDTTILYYTGLETEAAVRQFDKTILELRQQAGQAMPPRRRGGRR